MNRVISFLKNSNKKTFATVLAAGAVALVTVVGTVIAVGPTFNIFPIAYGGGTNSDYPLLDARNYSRNEGWSNSQSDHDAGITADPGEEIEFLIYYHNGAPDAAENIASNVIARASVPATAGNFFTIGASISSSNASTVTSSSKGGDIVVRVNGQIGQTLTLVPGSTVWMPNRNSSQQTMPDTITTSGVNLGDIRGCWQYAGFVKFRVRVSNTQPTSSLSITKEVRNITTGTGFADSVNANPDDTVEFRLTGRNTGQATIGHVYFSDVLPSRLTYIAGSLQPSQSALSGNLFDAGGLDLGSLSPNASATVTFRARVASASQFSSGTTNLDNIGSDWGQSPSVSKQDDTARVIVTIAAPQLCAIQVRATLNGANWSGSMNYQIVGPSTITNSTVPSDFADRPAGTYTASYISGGPSGATFTGIWPYTTQLCNSGSTITYTYNFTLIQTPNLTIDKTVKNVTAGTGYLETVSAQPSQTIEYKIVLTNTGNTTLTNVIVRDQLPEKVTYVPGTLTINGSVMGGESEFFSSSSTGGKNIGSMVASETKTIIFRVTLSGQNDFPVGTTTLTNTGHVRSSEISNRSDTATVTVDKSAPVKENGAAPGRPS